MQISHVDSLPKFVALNVCPCDRGFQASVQFETGGGWRVSIGATLSEALAGLIYEDESTLPAVVVPLAPPPY